MLAKAIGAIGAASINLEGYAEMEGVVHVLTTELPSTRRALEQAGFRVVTEQQVLLVPIADKPGAAATVFQRIANAKINVRYSYLATGNRLVIGANDLDAVRNVLEGV